MAVAELSRVRGAGRAFLAEHGITDATTPWWQIALCMQGQPGGTDESRLYKYIREGRADENLDGPDSLHSWPGWEQQWLDLCLRAARAFSDMPAAEAVRSDPAACRDAACLCIRALCQLIDMRDDEDRPMVFKDFHVRSIITLRRTTVAEVLLPYSHGKTWTSSLTIPLADWIENPDSTQIRVYLAEDKGREWTNKLLHFVETSTLLHTLTEGRVARPQPDDANFRTSWGVRGFALAGKKVVGYSFRPLTIRGSLTGLRADRIIADDLVDDRNAVSWTDQDKFYNLIKTGALTVRRLRPESWRSRYETVWGTFGLIGTIYDRRDVNFRMQSEIEEKRRDAKKTTGKAGGQYCVLRFSVYPHRDSRENGEVIWPEAKPLEYIRSLEDELGYRAFRMRLMNLPIDEGDQVFTANYWNVAVKHGENYEYGKRPPGNVRCVIGFDPAVGKRTKGTKYPAAVCVGYDPDRDYWYFIRYERWAVPMPVQIRRLGEWARELGCPVVVESNAQQESYKDWMTQLEQDVHVETYYTSTVKHDMADGVESFQPLFVHAHIAVCASGVQPSVLAEFRDEWLTWPGKYRDLVMAAWIAKRWLTQRHRKPKEGPPVHSAPDWVYSRGMRRTVDLSRYRRGA